MQEYKNDKLVRYDPAVCIHAGECVRGLPSVFNLSRKPWIDVNGASPAAVIQQVRCCPSGALKLSICSMRRNRSRGAGDIAPRSSSLCAA